MKSIKISKRSCLEIPIKEKESSWVKEILKDLTRSQPVYNSVNGEEEIKVYYRTNSKSILIPRFYNVLKYGIEVDDIVDDGSDINISLQGTPKNKRQRDSISWMVNNNNGVLCLSPGEGKTFVAIASICKIKKKTIVFVHKRSLVTQWIDRIITFTNLKNGQIGNLTSSNYENEIKKPIILTTVQSFISLIKKTEFRKLLFSCGIGMAIWDEAHVSSSAEQFSISSLFTPSKRVYGLSATPERLDGNTDIIFKHLGPVFTPNGKKDTLIPKIYMCHFDHGAVTASSSRYINWGGKFNRSRYLKKLCKSQRYISYTKKIIKKLYQENRNILFLTDRIDILDQTSVVISNQDDVGFFIPRSKKKRDEALTKKVIFSTYGSARDGTDLQTLDALVMATSTSNIEQCVGRVIRTFKGKKQPIVIDLIDTGSKDMMKRSITRKKFYEEQGWEIVIYNWE